MPYQHIENDVQLITAKAVADSTHLAVAIMNLQHWENIIY